MKTWRSETDETLIELEQLQSDAIPLEWPNYLDYSVYIGSVNSPVSKLRSMSRANSKITVGRIAKNMLSLWAVPIRIAVLKLWVILLSPSICLKRKNKGIDCQSRSRPVRGFFEESSYGFYNSELVSTRQRQRLSIYGISAEMLDYSRQRARRYSRLRRRSLRCRAYIFPDPPEFQRFYIVVGDRPRIDRSQAMTIWRGEGGMVMLRSQPHG